MSIEAMKLALDALDPRLGMPEPEYESLLRCALGELRAAIEQAEEQRPHYTWQYAKDYIASQQAEKQEPVAYWHRDPNLDPEPILPGGGAGSGVPTIDGWPLYSGLPPVKVARLLDEAFERGKKEAVSEQAMDIAQKLVDSALLNSAPPQREWQGLTNEEIARIYAEYKSPWNIYLAIESALREKNT